MSEPNAPSVDPRFDPRFQRGYVPDASAPADAGAAARPPAPASLPAPAPTVEPEPDPGAAPVFAALVDPDDPSSAITPWFIAGWGVSVVAAILGISLWWASISSQDYYGGPGSESDRWLQAFGWMVAPTLIEAGLLGVVVMLVWTGIRHARRVEEPG